jgi:N-acetylglucosamine kinase-like BadF-type ATPase
MAGDPPSHPVDDDRPDAAAAPDAAPPLRVAVLDAGASTLRAAVFEGEDELTRRTEHQGLPHPGAAAARAVIRERVAALLARLGHGPYSAVVLATTGIRRIGDSEQELREDLAAQLGTEVVLANDVVAGYLGALGPAPGLLLHAGTGSLVLALPERGEPVVLDGWGHLAGDRGSGFMLGRAGLRAAFDAVDGLAGPTRLTELLLGRDPEQVITDLHSSSVLVREVAGFAPHVLRAAAEGDATAQRLVEESVDALVRTGLVALERAGTTGREPEPDEEPLHVAGVGGLFADAHYRRVLTARVRSDLPRAELHLGGGDPLRGGLLLRTTAEEELTLSLGRAFGGGGA